MEELIRPNSPGFYWELVQSTNGSSEWRIVTVEMIYFGEEDSGERVLACTSGGVWARCDMINANGRDNGSRYFRANPPFNLGG